MNNTIHKKEIIDKVSGKLAQERIVVGGNKYAYKRKYHLKYTEAIINKVLDAFWDVVADTITDGDKIQIQNYMTISPKYYKAREVNSFDGSGKYIAAPCYKIKVAAKGRLQEACRVLLDKVSQKREFENE